MTPRAKSPSPPDNVIPIQEVTFKDNINPNINADTISLPKPPTVEDQSIIESVLRVFMNELKEQKRCQVEDQQRRD